MNVSTGVSNFFGFLRYAFSIRERRGLISTLFLVGTFILCNEPLHEVLRYSTDYLLFLVLYPLCTLSVMECFYKYFWKGER